MDTGFWAVWLQSFGLDYRWDLTVLNGRWQAESLDLEDNPLRGRIFYSRKDAMDAVRQTVAAIVPTY